MDIYYRERVEPDPYAFEAQEQVECDEDRLTDVDLYPPTIPCDPYFEEEVCPS